ncbi:MAG: HAD family hydrolase [Acidimicrobiia bacterium]|nr:HAD family hydrolase [Acidimicrobiia bacterium]
MTKAVLWDFDETLAERPGRWWGCMLEIIERRLPGRVVDASALRAALQACYPWHFPDVVHEHLNDPDAWWAALRPGLEAAAVAGGLDHGDAAEVAAEVRWCYAQPETFRLYDDTTEALRMLRDAGWRQAIVSNHCPELEDLVDGLGIGAFFERVFSSACTGYEKPHPRAIWLALDELGVGTAWMLGNSATSDIAGADAAGIPSVLVVRDRPAPLVDAARRVLAADVDGTEQPTL